MFSTLRNRFGIPGVVSVIALVFAMFGGAYAASNSSGGGKATASAKAKKGPRGPKGATGPAGPAGPAGPQGPAGAKGDAGANGANGTNGAPGSPGAPGQSVTTTEILPLEECGQQSGVMLHSASGENEVCNGEDGEDGSPWTAGGVLPSGKTETGAWADTIPASGSGQAAISFTVPLAADIEEAKVRLNDFGTETFDPACDTFVNGTPVPPFGTPIPDPGYLCVYKVQGLATINGVNKALFGNGASEVGALIQLSGLEGQDARGEWAVTAP
ncbi:MAG TPA: hypothetical protein VGC63_02705 [Solirubrobacterales bacterium]|jgi:hypothetical protein